MPTNRQPERLYSYEDVIRIEDEQLLRRRKKLFGEQETAENLKESKFGIALSGGGIRSATFNLGILKTLNHFGLLKKADYLSTVSGGGYTGAYVQATLKNKGDEKELFHDDHIEHLRRRGEYMVPESGLKKRWNLLLLIIGYLISLIMSWVSPAIVILMFYILYAAIGKIFNFASLESVGHMISEVQFYQYGLIVLGGVVIFHFISNLILKFNIDISLKFNRIEALLVLIGLGWGMLLIGTGLRGQELLLPESVIQNLLLAAGLFIVGYFANPNALSFHRFYRNQLTDAYLHFTGPHRNVVLSQLCNPQSENIGDYLAPYPLINTCLNLQSSNDKKFKGAKANDYFLLSPLYCGAKLCTYVPTATTSDYKEMTLPAATTISAAAVNPGMGMYSNKLLSVLMTLMNARLGFWINNPLKMEKGSTVWWPVYFFYELFSWIGTDHRKLNISDGGHIENLGVYELLRRKCRLIIAVDAGADPTYGFRDLENLTVRARNELGLAISFRSGEHPEEIIRPKPSHGYSEKRFAIADVFQLWEEIVPRDQHGQMITDLEKKPIELLINYKKIQEQLQQIDDYSLQSLCDALAQISPDNLSDSAILEANVQKLDPRIRLIYNQLLNILQGVKQLENKLHPSIDKAAPVQFIINTIINRVKSRLKTGTLVYVKSSVVAPKSKLRIEDKSSLEYKTYKYKVYHPNFPHEPTSDQFFDQVQWESYYRLGQFIAGDVLGIGNLQERFTGAKATPEVSIEDLLCHFDEGMNLLDKPEKKSQPTEVAMAEPPEVEATKGGFEAIVETDIEEIEEKEAIQPEEEVAAMPPEEVENQAQGLPPAAKPEEKIVIGGEDEYSM